MRKQTLFAIAIAVLWLMVASTNRALMVGAATPQAALPLPTAVATGGVSTSSQPLVNPCTGQPFKTIATGTALKDAQVQNSPIGDDQYVVAFMLATNEEARRFTDYTAANVGQQIAIVIDGVVITSPVVQSAMTTDGQIMGNFTRSAAQKLAIQLQYGALPFALTLNSISKTPDGTELVLSAPSGVAVDPEKLKSARQIIEYRLGGLDAGNATVKLAANTIVIELPAPADTQSIAEAITQPGLLEFVDFSRPKSCLASMPESGQSILTDLQISRRQPSAAPTDSPK